VADVLGLELSTEPEDIGGISGNVKAVKTQMRVNISSGNERTAETFKRAD